MSSYTDRVPLSFVETKSTSLVWHYRQSPPDFAAYQARKLDEELQVGLANEPVSVTLGSMIVEAKAIDSNKGAFIKWILDTEPSSTMLICVGDDRTDEDMFKVVDPRVISVKVGKNNSQAKFRINSQEEVYSFLNDLFQMRHN